MDERVLVYGRQFDCPITKAANNHMKYIVRDRITKIMYRNDRSMSASALWFWGLVNHAVNIQEQIDEQDERNRKGM